MRATKPVMGHQRNGFLWHSNLAGAGYLHQPKRHGIPSDFESFSKKKYCIPARPSVPIKKCVLCTPEVQYFWRTWDDDPNNDYSCDFSKFRGLGIFTNWCSTLPFGWYEWRCRRRSGERTCWGVSFLDREQGSGGAWNLFFLVFNEKLGSIKIYLLVGGLEHVDCFSIYWE